MSDCVPYAIHIATGEDLPVVMSLAAQKGWDSVQGWNGIAGWCLLRDMGFQITSMKQPENPVTVKRFLPTLDEAKTYIICVKHHWFTVRRGQRFDKANTHPRTKVFAVIEVQPPIPAT
ncbi:hypothetical protein D3C85_1462050 [compost metagenome]